MFCRKAFKVILLSMYFKWFCYCVRYWVEGYNCRPRKDDMIPFPLKKTGFLFFVADHLQVGQLCTNPKSDRSLLSCLKVTQCSTSKIGDALLYNSGSLPIKVMTTGPLPAPSKCKSRRFNVSRVMKTKFLATVMVMPPHIFEVGLKVNTKVYLDVLKSMVMTLVQSGGRWPTLGVAAGLIAGPQVQRDPGLASEEVLRLCTLLSLPPFSPDLNPLDNFVW